MADGDPEENPSFVKKALQTPCYRTSMLFGISTGIISGLGFFLFTSRARRAAHVGLGSYVSGALASWVYCRYRLTQRLIAEREFKRAVQQKILLEGVTTDDGGPVVAKVDEV